MRKRGSYLIRIPCGFLGMTALVVSVSAFARDDGRWEGAPLRRWFSELMQPDRVDASCCGDADVYFADEYAIEPATGDVSAVITDNRGNPIPVGTRIVVPRSKVNKDRNMTDHTLLFVRGTAGRPVVFCFVPGMGV